MSYKTFFWLLVLLLSGCVSGPQLIAEKVGATSTPVEASKTRIVFLNPSNSIAGAFLSEIYSPADNERRLLGMAGSKMKVVVDLEPGTRMFMCRTGKRSHFMKAENLEPGKTYYVVMRFIYGAGFQLRPVRNTSGTEFSFSNPEFKTWESSTKEMVLASGTEDYVRTKFGKFADSSYEEYWKEWQGKSDSQRAELTLNSDDYAR